MLILTQYNGLIVDKLKSGVKDSFSDAIIVPPIETKDTSSPFLKLWFGI